MKRMVYNDQKRGIQSIDQVTYSLETDEDGIN